MLLEDGEVIATSQLRELNESILLVNSDLYMTGTVNLEEISLPDVIANLSETTFHVRDYPESGTEKMPLILISRYIERLSYVHGGDHRASFQRLSRLQDEKGTRNVYRRLVENDVNTHVYGVPDWMPSRELGVTVHAGWDDSFTSTWFVTHTSDEASAALVAIELGSNEWVGRWTFDSGKVQDIERTIKKHL